MLISHAHLIKGDTMSKKKTIIYPIDEVYVMGFSNALDAVLDLFDFELQEVVASYNFQNNRKVKEKMKKIARQIEVLKLCRL